MKKKLLLSLLVSVLTCQLILAEITPEKPTPEDVLSVLGYSWWKFSIPNEKKLKNLQCTMYVYTKDKQGVWSKQQIYANSFNQTKDAKAPERFNIGFYQKGNEIVLKLESQSNSVKVANKYGLDELDQTAKSLTVDENGDFVLKWKSSGLAETGKKESMQSYLAMHVSIAEGLR